MAAKTQACVRDIFVCADSGPKNLVYDEIYVTYRNTTTNTS